MLADPCLGETISQVTDLLNSENLWTASNAALVLARYAVFDSYNVVFVLFFGKKRQCKAGLASTFMIRTLMRMIRELFCTHIPGSAYQRKVLREFWGIIAVTLYWVSSSAHLVWMKQVSWGEMVDSITTYTALYHGFCLFSSKSEMLLYLRALRSFCLWPSKSEMLMLLYLKALS